MVKRLIAIGFLLVSIFVATNAAAQFPSCQIANDFFGSTQTSPGDYTIVVTPHATGNLTAICDSFIDSFFWSPGGVNSQTITVTTPASGGVAYTLTGCTGPPGDLSCVSPVTISIRVEVAQPDCTLVASPNPAVSGQTVTFTATCELPAAQIAYTDLNGNSAVSSSLTFTNIAPAVTSPTVRNVVYHGIGLNGEIGVEKVLQVTINPGPQIPPPSNCTLTAQPNPVQINNSFTLTAACSGGDPVTNYVFVGPNGQVFAAGSANTVNVQATTLGALSYTVRASNAGGQASVSTTVNVIPPPPAACTATANPNPILLGQQSLVSVTCSGGAPTNFAFTYPDGTVVNQTSNTLAVTPTTIGTHTITVVASNAGGAAPPASVNIVVQQTLCTITPSVPNPLPRNSPITLTASCNNAPVFYQWSTSAGPIQGQTGASLTVTPTTTTTYTVSATSASTAAPIVATGQYTVVVSQAAAIVNIAGATISGLPGRPLSRALDVRVTDQSGNPVAGEIVNWSVVSSGSNPGTFATNPSPPTNALGVTTNTFTMGSDPGGRTLRACLASLPSVCAEFQVIAAASQISALPGGPLVGSAGRTLRELAVQARDPQGNLVAGEIVNWSVVNPGPNPGTFAVNPSPPTDAQGITRNTFTMGSDPGGRTLRACLASTPTVCADFLVQSVNAALDRPVVKIMSPMAEVAVQTPLTQIYNIRMRLEQLRLRRNPSVIEALRVSVAGKALPSWRALAIVPTDKNGKPTPQKGGGAAADQDPFERLGAFVNGDVEIGKQSSTGAQNGYDLNTKGITAGVDYRLPGDSVIGLGVGYVHAETDLNDGGGDQGASGYSFSAYGSFVPAQGAYIDVIVHGGRNKYDTRRREVSTIGSSVEYTSDTRGRQFAAAVTAGADINRGPVTLNPYARVDYVNAKIDGFNESGDAGAITIRDATFRTTIVTLGGQASYAMSTSWGVLMPNARLELQRRVQGDNRNVTAALVADGTINTVAALESVDRNFGNVTIGASAVLPRGISGFVNIERLFGRDSYTNMKYTAGVRFEF